MRMSVGAILKSKGSDVETISGDATVGEAVARLRDAEIGALVVSSDGQSVDGVLSERDVVAGLADHGAEILGRKVEDVMTSRVATCSPDDGVEKVMLEMTELRARHFPVVEGGRLVGIVTIGDVVKNRLDEVQLEKNVLRDSYIAGR
jgi:CBS domain-containing protein